VPRTSAATPHRALAADGPVTLPSLTAYLDVGDWDACANSLGGPGNSLFAGFASRLGVRLGRVWDDGTATLSFPVSERTDDDTRANALLRARVIVDPTDAARDLTEIRARTKRAFADVTKNAAEFKAPLPLATITPRWLARKTANLAQGTAERPITCSNLGDLDPAANRPDGTDAARFAVRMIEPHIPRSRLDATGGQLNLLLGRVAGKVFVSVSAYPAGSELREMTSRTFGEFGLDPEID
jgi:hypothetical protein